MTTVPLNEERGTTLIELLVSLVVFGVIVLGILPVMHQANMSDTGSQSMTRGSQVAAQIMETLKIFRAIQNEGGTVPSGLNDFAVQVDPYQIDGTGVWSLLSVDPDLYEMRYTLSTEANTGKLLARVGVTSKVAFANKGGGNRWVEFSSGIE